MNAEKPTIVIAGAGPAGVLEQHPDFGREFRGDLIGPSVLPKLVEARYAVPCGEA